MTLYYCPLESYRERYTMQLSAPRTGWMESRWIENGVDYVRVTGEEIVEDILHPDAVQYNIDTPTVLDSSRRATTCFHQVLRLINLLPVMKPDDVIYFDDFWHPGIEAIGYAAQSAGRPIPKMYAKCHAQSVDEYDFTRKMLPWIRHFEQGIGALLSGIFVANTLLKTLVVNGGISTYHQVHAVGHPFNSAEVKGRMNLDQERENKVIFSSRWDDEKQPGFFLDVVDRVIQMGVDVHFVICTSSHKLKSNNQYNLEMLQQSRSKYTSRLTVCEDLEKEEYYQELCTAKIQINTALQDWISYALLEASCAGCYPVYPNYRSFPEVFMNNAAFMYNAFDVESCAMMIKSIIERDDLWTVEAIEHRAWIHEQYDSTWDRMATIMGVPNG